jgi:hypothetical protein
MFVKTKESSGHTTFYLCISEDGGTGGRGWKSVEYSLCLGESLDWTSARWLEILRGSGAGVFQTVPLQSVLDVLEQYAAEHGIPPKSLNGLREALHASKHRKTARQTIPEGAPVDEARRIALRVLGLAPDSSERQIESAFRKAARRHHPDVGGDPAKFRSIVDARNLLLGRDTRMGEPA